MDILENKKARGCPIRVPWRFDSDGTLIVTNPTFREDYKHNYTNKYSCKVICNLCNREVSKNNCIRHKTSKICKTRRSGSDTESPTDSI